jgi:hypothetical protein
MAAGTDHLGGWIMIDRNGVATPMPSGGRMSARPWSRRGGNSARWDIVSIQPGGIDLARGEEPPLSIAIEDSRFSIDSRPALAVGTVHALHPRWYASVPSSLDETGCCLEIMDREEGHIRHRLRIPWLTTLTPRLTRGSQQMAFSSNGEYFIARHISSVSGGQMQQEWVWLRLKDGLTLRESQQRRTGMFGPLFVANDGRGIGIVDRESDLLTPNADGSRLERRGFKVGDGAVALIGDRLVHSARDIVSETPLAGLDARPREVVQRRGLSRRWALSGDGSTLAYVGADGSVRIGLVATGFEDDLGPLPNAYSCLLKDGRHRSLLEEAGKPVAVLEEGWGAAPRRWAVPPEMPSTEDAEYFCDSLSGTGFLITRRGRQMDVWRQMPQLDSFQHLGRTATGRRCHVKDFPQQGRQILLGCRDGLDGMHRFHAFPPAVPQTQGLDALRSADVVFASDDFSTVARIRPPLADDRMATVEWFDPKHPPPHSLRPMQPLEPISVFSWPALVKSADAAIVAVASAQLGRVEFWHRGKAAPVVARWVGSELRAVREGLHSGVFTLDARHFLACVGGRVVGFDTHSGKLTHELDLNEGKSPCFVLPGATLDDTLAVHRQRIKRIRIRAVDAEPVESVLAAAGSHPHELGFLQDNRILVSTHDDGLIRFWDIRQRRPLVSLFAGQGRWAVIAPDGRFDVSDFDDALPFSWVLPDQPFKALPIESFMRDRYYPGLLSLALAPAGLPAAPTLASLDRTLPATQIVNVEPGTADASVVDVTVSLTYAGNGTTADDGRGVTEVQLYRDARLVATRRWQTPQRSADITFPGIRLPTRAPEGETEFTAYAFNAARVRGEASLHRHSLRAASAAASPAPPRRRRAFVVAVGIDAHADARWDLRFAGNDAAAIAQQLPRHLTGPFEEVVTTRIDAVGPFDSERHGSIKRRLRAALVALSSGPGSATPDDAVFLTFSGHGVRSAQGGLLLVTPDAPARGRTPDSAEFVARSISVDELSEWLREVDAGSFTLIIDACHAGASVEAQFRPAPFGDRGFGQLAYDKGMRLLAASQPDNVAVESAMLQQGVLTYVLVQEGLKKQQGKWQSVGGRERMAIGDWLRFGMKRVPEINLAGATGQGGVLDAADRGATLVMPASGTLRARAGLQRPVLFDFDRGARLGVKDIYFVPVEPAGAKQ